MGMTAMKKIQKIALIILCTGILGLIVPVHADTAIITGNPAPVLLWSAPTGSTESMSDNAAKVACSGDGKYVVAGYGAGIVEFRDRNGSVLWRWQSPHSYYAVWQVAASGNGEYAGISLYDPYQNNRGELDYFDRAGNLLWSRPFFGIESLSGNGNVVALAEGSTISFYNATGHFMGTTTLDGYSWTMAISPDGSAAAAGVTTKDYAGYLYVIAVNGMVLWSVPAGSRSQTVAFSRDGNYLAAADVEKLRYFTRGGEVLWRYNSTPEFTGVAVSSDGAFIAASSQYYLRYFNKSGTKLWEYEVPTLPTKPGPYLSHLTMSDDGGYLSVTTDSNRTLFFNRTGDLLWQRDSTHWVRSTGMSRDGKYLVVGMEQDFMYFDTGIDVPVAEPGPTGVAGTVIRTPAPTSTPQASVPGIWVIAGICIGILMHTVYRKK